MAEEFEIIRANLLPAAGTITDNDMILIVQGGRPKRALPSAMKGKQGDPGLSAFLGVSSTYILWKQGANGTWQNLLELEKIRGPKGEKPVFRKLNGTLQMKYEGEPDSAFVNIFDREELKMKFSDLTPAEVDQLKLHFSDLTDADIKVLQKPAQDAADRLNELSDHRDKVVDGYWWSWNEKEKKYFNTGEIAKGNVMYATFYIDLATGNLEMTTPEEYAGPDFSLDKDGNLCVTINE